MISEIKISNFKCFQKERTFEFSKLNLLTGINGRGKSSLLQAIITLSKSAEHYFPFQKMSINNEYLQLGMFSDVKNSETLKGATISFNVKCIPGEVDLPHEIEVHYEEDYKNSLIAKAKHLKFKRNDWEKVFKEEEDFAHLEADDYRKTVAFSSFLRRVHFVSADRIGPVKYFDKVDLTDFVNVGAKGQNSINILANSLNLGLVNKNLYLGKDAESIEQQTQEWLSYILDGANIEIKGKEAESSILYMLLNNRNSSKKYKSVNVGFGYSYILPLIVTGLIAKEGDIVIIENPEAHLHPRAQSRIAEFFCKVASCGVQVFIESHSEHILNGFRVGTLNKSIDITSDDFVIHYFEESFDSRKLKVDNKGKIDNWPVGFFDQQEIDFSNIFKYSM